MLCSYSKGGAPFDVKLLVGTWRDGKNSVYEVELEAPGDSCSVFTKRPSGLTKFANHQIMHCRDGSIWWGHTYELDTSTSDSCFVKWVKRPWAVPNPRVGEDFLWRREEKKAWVPNGMPEKWNELCRSPNCAASSSREEKALISWPSWQEEQERLHGKQPFALQEKAATEVEDVVASPHELMPFLGVGIKNLVEFLLERPTEVEQRAKLLMLCVETGVPVVLGSKRHSVTSKEVADAKEVARQMLQPKPLVPRKPKIVTGDGGEKQAMTIVEKVVGDAVSLEIQLRNFYQCYRPDKVLDAGRVAAAFAFHQEELNRRLREKYGRDLNDKLADEPPKVPDIVSDPLSPQDNALA